MDKIDKVPEVSEIKTCTVAGYRNIEPLDKVTDQETADFIAREFEKVHEETELDAYDRLLSEIFNRSEEELDIDFEISNQLYSILETFNGETWKPLDINERILAIRELVKALGNELGLEKSPEVIVTDFEDDEYGSYDVKNNTISLNGKYLDNAPELVNTIAHEMRHAYQHRRADVQETWEDQLYNANFENYISPVPLPGGGRLFYTDYMDQYVEVDARAFANQFTEAMKHD